MAHEAIQLRFYEAYNADAFDDAYEIFQEMTREERARYLRMGVHLDMLYWAGLNREERIAVLFRLHNKERSV